jgi:hypothetical protein
VSYVFSVLFSQTKGEFAMITPEQLAQVQADLDAVKAAVAEETNATMALNNDQDAMDDLQEVLNADAVALNRSQAAVVAADQTLLADVTAMVNANPTV